MNTYGGAGQMSQNIGNFGINISGETVVEQTAAAGGDALLLEDGSYLLLEDGSKLLLE